ncbi:MAG: family 14 glycosylhydrolase [Pirellulaceae bacterium]
MSKTIVCGLVFILSVLWPVSSWAQSGQHCMAVALAGAESSVPTPVPRAGRPGAPLELGTSVMNRENNLLVKSLGFSSAQTDSDHLTVNQPEPDQWDWKDADAGLKAMREAGMRWQYFPHFHWPPEWYRQSPRFVPSIGLRSKKRLPCMSLWSPDIRPWFEQGYAALAEHYGNGTDNVYAIYLGIQGDFGETMFPVGFHPGERERFGEQGTGVPDFWCGDEHARQDFRRFAQERYDSIEKLNAAWGVQYGSFDEIDYPPAAYANSDVTLSAPSRRRWLDFNQWYYDSMTRFTAEVCRIARKYFPDSLLVLPVGGGCEHVVYGQDPTRIPKVAKQYGVHVRSTHGGYLPYANGYPQMLKRIATPCKFYGVPHWLEPPGTITASGEVGRIMEAISCGNWGFWDWGSNPVGAADVFREYANFLTREKPVVDVALFFPTTDHRLHPHVSYPQRLADMGTLLRDVMDYDVVDEDLIADDALASYRVLAWLEGEYVEAPTCQRIDRWVNEGGVVIHWGASDIQSVEGQTGFGRQWMGLAPEAELKRLDKPVPVEPTRPDILRHVTAFPDRCTDSVATALLPECSVLLVADGLPAAWAVPRGKGWVVVWVATGDAPPIRRAFCELVRDVVYNLAALDPTKINAREVDTDWDGVYATFLPNGEAILYNATDEPKTKTIGSNVISLPPASLRSVLVED